MTTRTIPEGSAETNTCPRHWPSKLLGTYPQKQKGLCMQRIPVFAGRIDWPQWQTITRLAIKYTDNTPLHITTRQDIELHNVPEADLPDVLLELNQVGIFTYGACGDSVRNITINPACEFDPQSFDVIPLAQLIREHLHSLAAQFNMPRKFKISFSGSWHHHARPYLNDLGFVAVGENTFEVIGAGSLGASPQTGIILYENLPAEDLLPLCQAALEMFVELGDRQNRHKARLRHVRQRLGDEPFKKQLHGRFQAIRRQQPWPTIILSRGREGYERPYILQIPQGDLDPYSALELAEAAQEKGSILRINLAHGLELYGTKPFDLPDKLKPYTNLPCVVACPGASTCPKALVHTKEIAGRIQQLDRIDLKGEKIAVSGCPNGCAHSAAADIGLIGRIKTIEGQRTEYFDILLGGGNGKTDKLAEKSETIPAEQIPQWFLQNFNPRTAPAAVRDDPVAPASGG